METFLEANIKIVVYCTMILSSPVPLDLALHSKMNILVGCWHKAEQNEA